MGPVLALRILRQVIQSHVLNGSDLAKSGHPRRGQLKLNQQNLPNRDTEMLTIVIAPVPAGNHDASMSHLGSLSGASLLILSLAACTTQSYGRVTPVSEREKSLLTCEQIAIEIEKAEFFIADIQQQRGETTSAHVIGALLDFGIGNSIEGNAAEASGHDRLRDLQTLQAERGCNG